MERPDERVKADFAPQGLEHARRQTWKALELIAARIRPGMLEEEAYQLTQEVLTELGSPTFWHRAHVRFGVNTLCTFNDPAKPGVRLGENDIFFIDLGPVWENPDENGARYEGDAGITGFTGEDPEHRAAATAVRELFEATRAEWKKTGRSGKDLYDWMKDEAHRKGWVLQLNADGHRISDFPHRLYSKKGISELDYSPSPDVWVLEVQLRHPTRDFGAFYEDILS
jgi:Xaa-Pro aminopeptidase